MIELTELEAACVLWRLRGESHHGIGKHLQMPPRHIEEALESAFRKIRVTQTGRYVFP